MRSRSKRLRNALIGGGIGLALAVTADQTIGRFLNNEGGYHSGAHSLIRGLPIGIGAGLSGATASYPTIYRAARK